jgi:MFS family permease
MVVLDFFIVNVALPSIQQDMHASGGAIEFVVAGYALTSAVFLITAARLGDRIGRRRTFSIGLGLFTLASAVCGLADSPTTLVLARLVQGGGAALLMPNVLSIIGVSYSGADRARAIGVYGLVMGLAAACGQLIGGALVQANIAGLGWRSCFLINVPVGALALALAPRLVPESRNDTRSRLDLLGTILLTAGLTAVVLPLVEGRAHGWPLWTWISLGGAPLILLGFAWHQRRSIDPARILVRPGVVLPRARAVPAARLKVERARRGAGVHHPRGGLRGGLLAGTRADPAARSAGGCRRCAGVGKRTRPAARRGG